MRGGGRIRHRAGLVSAAAAAAALVAAPVPSTATDTARPDVFGTCGAAFLTADTSGTLARTELLATPDDDVVVADVVRADGGRDVVRLWRVDGSGSSTDGFGSSGVTIDLGVDTITALWLAPATGGASWVVADTSADTGVATHAVVVNEHGATATPTLVLPGWRPRATAGRPDGGLVLATYDPDTEQQRVSSIRPDATLDTSFDGDGHADLAVSPPVGAATASSSEVAVVGASDSDVTAWRLGSDGAPTTAFGGDGRSDVQLPTTTVHGARFDGSALTVLVAPDGADVATLRLRSDGTPDPAHGTDGVRSTTTDPTRGLQDVAFTQDGGLAGVNTLFLLGDRQDLEVHRLTSELTREPAFADGGVATFAPRTPESDVVVIPRAVTEATDGDVLIVGTRNQRGARHPVVARLTTAGARDGHPWCDLAVGDARDPAVVQRLAGDDRYATAAAISSTAFAPGVDTVLVATGQAFPDALAGGPAASLVDGPVLLVRFDRIPPPIAAELHRLRPRRIVVLGGTSAITDEVATQLGTYAVEPVERIAGADRYATAAAASARFFPDGADTAFVATGTNFPDALAGVPAAAAAHAPILLVTRDDVPSATAAELDRLGAGTVVVLGGSAAVDDQVISQLEHGGRFVRRIAGPNRYVTAAHVVREVPSSSVVFVATGRSFPDALAGGALAGSMSAPVVLVDDRVLELARHDLATGHRPGRIIVLGGPTAVGDDAAGALGRDGVFGYRVRRINSDGTPARWNACRPIHWVFNPDGAYAGALDDVHEGVRRIEQATGLDLVYDGITDEPAPSNGLDRRDPGKYPPVWVGWIDLGGFTDSGTAGRATVVRWPNDEGQDVTTTGIVQFNRNAIGFFDPGYTGPDMNWGEIVVHELAHLTGLGHGQGLMAPSPLGGPVSLLPPDVRGLEAVGVASGCQLDP